MNTELCPSRENPAPTPLLDEDACWQAVLTRDVSAVPNFFYAVRSTGVYCRPVCPARRPSRAQTCFFPTPEAAENAGFRSCLRCRPREATARAEQMLHVCRYIESHLDEPLGLPILSALVNLSPEHFQRTFKQTLGVTPRAYADACRLGHFKEQLKSGTPVTEALVESGYGSTSRLYERSPKQLGMTPTAYRKGGPEMTLMYTTTETRLGTLLVAATPNGICAVSLGESEAALESALRSNYPKADWKRDEAGLSPWVAQLIRHLEGQQPDLALPLDVRATAFQRRVWQELQAIPFGSTRTYGQVAQAIGHPTATRAVASACASNPVALIVPCHRVVRGDGGLGGYRWGEGRKKQILRQEKESAAENSFSGEETLPSIDLFSFE